MREGKRFAQGVHMPRGVAKVNPGHDAIRCLDRYHSESTVSPLGVGDEVKGLAGHAAADGNERILGPVRASK
jgi:hypothetical protein